ncbi:MAG: GAF domain-containing protein [Sedimentisphaerales bacterium]|nr:GAF domain-containing protein [Sedimentisphaerales bacterium]
MYGGKNKSSRTAGGIDKPVSETESKPNPLVTLTGAASKSQAGILRNDILFHATAGSSTDAVTVIQYGREVLYMNPAALELLGDCKYLTDVFNALPSAARFIWREAVDACLAGQPSSVMEHPGPHKSWWLTRFITLADPKLRAVVVVSTNITEIRKVREDLTKANRALRVIGRCNEILVRSTDEKALLGKICRAVVNVEGYKLVWIGYKIDDEAKTVRPVAHAGFEDGYLETVNITWADKERGRGPTGTAIRTGKAFVLEDILNSEYFGPWREQAITRGYASSVALPMIHLNEVLGALNVYSDEPDAFGSREVDLLMELASDLAYGIMAIREKAIRIKMEREILDHEARLRELTAQLALSEEHERHRIATGVHDEIGQKLAMAKMEISRLRSGHAPMNLAASLDTLAKQLDVMIEDAHYLTFELSNPILYHIGFAAAVESWLTDYVEDRYGIETEFVCADGADRLGICEDIRITLFQIVRELLANIIKHAGATKVKVRIQSSGGNLEVAVEDNGAGFDVSEKLGAWSLSRSGGFGLFNVKERIEYFGGRLDIESSVGHGTRITVTMPLVRKSG